MEPVVIAFGGGKGGTGKSTLAVQFSISFAQRGFRVVLVDADPNGANLHTFFGLEDPSVSIQQMLDEEQTSTPEQVNALILPSGVPQLGILPGFRDMIPLHFSGDEIQDVAQRLRLLDADLLILDVGSGSGRWPVILFEDANAGVLVSLPEATCIERDYHFLRHVCQWRIHEQLGEEKPPVHGWLPVPWLASVRRSEPEKAREMQDALRRRAFFFLVNQYRSPEQGKLSGEFLSVVRRFFGIQGYDLGALGYDERLLLAIQQRQPILLSYPDSRWVEKLQEISDELLQLVQGESS